MRSEHPNPKIDAKKHPASRMTKMAIALACVTSSASVLSQVNVLEEVVVTSTKRGDTALMSTPISVNVVSGEDLKFRQIRGPEDLRTAVSGVYIDEGSSTPRVAIRGVGFDNFNVQAENGVTTYVDGVIIQRTHAILAGFLDLAQVEVLKGPQGSAFGRNATGGSINLITAKPQEGFSGEVSGEFGSFSRKGFGAVLNNGGDTFGIRLAASYEDDDGYITNLVTGNDKLGAKEQTLARLSMAWNPSDTFSLDYSLSYTDYELIGPGQTHTNAGSAASAAGFGMVLGLTPLYAGPLTNVLNDDYTIVNRQDPHTERESTLHALTMEFDLGWASLKSITGYMDFESSWGSDVAVPSAFAEGLISVNTSDSESDQFSQEFLLSGSSDRLSWVTGLYYLEEEAEDSGTFNLSVAVANGLPAGTVFRNSGNGQKLTSYAVFADGQLELTDQLRLNAGVRWTDDEKEAFGRERDIVFPGGAFVIPGAPLDEAKVSDSTVTWQIGLEFDINEDLFSYVRIAEGYKAGGINNNNLSFYDPEELLSYEIGLKGELDQLNFSIAAFYSEYENIQLFINPPNNPGAADIINAAEATISGIDLDATWQASDALSFDVKVTWLAEAEYDSFQAVDLLTDPVNPVDFSGALLNRSPEFTGVLGANLHLPIGDRIDLTARAEVFSTSEVAFSFLNQVRADGALEQDGYELINLYITATIDENLDVRVYGKNIGDEFYIASAAEGAAGWQYGSSGRPDEYGLEVRYRF